MKKSWQAKWTVADFNDEFDVCATYGNFDIILDHSLCVYQRYAAPHAPCAVPCLVPVHRLLIGACDPMPCPIHIVRYPKLFGLPTDFDAARVAGAARFRSKGRLPILSWISPRTGAPLCRCSQPMTGITGMALFRPLDHFFPKARCMVGQKDSKDQPCVAYVESNREQRGGPARGGSEVPD